MRHSGRGSVLSLGFVWLMTTAVPLRAQALLAVETLRVGGCGGVVPASRPLHHDARLDQAARGWARGRALAAAVADSGFAADTRSGVHVSGPDAGLLGQLRLSGCRGLASPSLRDIGLYQHGQETWFVLAEPLRSPSGAERSPPLASRAVQLVNQVRAQGRRCGTRWFTPVPPVMPSSTLGSVALGHALDMAEHDYFEHEDLSGHTPAQRVRAVGYREKLVGENIAYGPKTIDEVVQGWLDSPGHCENIMDPRFAEMGIGYAPGQLSRRGLYWVQLLAAPRS